MCGFSPPLFHGRGIFNYTFGLLPYRKPVFTVGKIRVCNCAISFFFSSFIVGKPIVLEKAIPEPSGEEINLLHERYKQALSELFEEHKLKYGVPEKAHLHFR